MSANTDPTFVFQNNRVYAFENGKVVASGDDIEEVERIVAAAESCPNCDNKGCPDCKDNDDEKDEKKSSSRIITPNGLKGQVLGRTKNVWGDHVTIRWENGRIASYNITSDAELPFADKEEVKETPVQELQRLLDQGYDHSAESLKARASELAKIKHTASSLIAQGTSNNDEQELDLIVMSADHETGEIQATLEALEDEDLQAFHPPAPFHTEVVEQESMGGNDSTWLDQVTEEMLSENEANDFNKIMDEGPEMFVADMDTPSLADARTVREMASSFVQSKTASIKADAKEDFKNMFLTRVERCRRRELESRKIKQTKRAKAEPSADGPAEGLFL